MKVHSVLAIAALMGFSLLVSPALAEKPSWAGKGGGGENEDRRERGDKKSHGKEGREESSTERFGSRHSDVVRNYYVQEQRGGKKCPPGLAKKNNGCMPPGQARKWSTGKPLPSDVEYHPVPDDLVRQLGVPVSGYRYVRVAGDILKIAVAGNVVVDAIKDLGMR